MNTLILDSVSYNNNSRYSPFTILEQVDIDMYYIKPNGIVFDSKNSTLTTLQSDGLRLKQNNDIVTVNHSGISVKQGDVNQMSMCSMNGTSVILGYVDEDSNPTILNKSGIQFGDNSKITNTPDEITIETKQFSSIIDGTKIVTQKTITNDEPYIVQKVVDGENEFNILKFTSSSIKIGDDSQTVQMSSVNISQGMSIPIYTPPVDVNSSELTSNQDQMGAIRFLKASIPSNPDASYKLLEYFDDTWKPSNTFMCVVHALDGIMRNKSNTFSCRSAPFTIENNFTTTGSIVVKHPSIEAQSFINVSINNKLKIFRDLEIILNELIDVRDGEIEIMFVQDNGEIYKNTSVPPVISVEFWSFN